MLTVAASLVLAAPLQAATTKPKKPKPETGPTREEVYAYCKKKYGNGGPMRVVKKGDKWWCYTWG